MYIFTFYVIILLTKNKRKVGDNLQEAKIGNTNALKYKNKEDLQKGIDAYFEECDNKKLPYTMSGLAESLEIDRSTLVRYGERDSYANLIKKAKQKVERQLEENALMGKANSVFTIFNLKNNYGWQDKMEMEVRKDPIEDLTPLAELLKGEKK